MHSKYKIALAVMVGAAFGAVAVQGLHAQAKPKAYIVTETEVIDAAALEAYRPKIIAAIQAAGGRRVIPAGAKMTALVGDPPKRIGITEWDSVEKAQAYRNSDAFKNLSAERAKATKTIRSFIVEGAN